MDFYKDFYKTSAWRHKREIILRRDDYLCQNCRRYGRTRQATTVHHIIHLEDAPELAFDSNNLISLCAACHAEAHPEKGDKHLNLKKGERNGYYQEI